ncbi:MAG: hypothetical protein ACE361_11445 [Aureliella sp.]
MSVALRIHPKDRRRIVEGSSKSSQSQMTRIGWIKNWPATSLPDRNEVGIRVRRYLVSGS